ncbi:hypothetical protein MP638_006708 [Amoeboaphelidium occidentale]|nr:hypothetical protein MP638_006708 [Amoeboaphelidium occidentale]
MKLSFFIAALFYLVNADGEDPVTNGGIVFTSPKAGAVIGQYQLIDIAWTTTPYNGSRSDEVNEFLNEPRFIFLNCDGSSTDCGFDKVIIGIATPAKPETIKDSSNRDYGIPTLEIPSFAKPGSFVYLDFGFYGFCGTCNSTPYALHIKSERFQVGNADGSAGPANSDASSFAGMSSYWALVVLNLIWFTL